MQWMIFSDKYGRDPTVNDLQTTLDVNNITMIDKRIERGENLDIAAP